MQNLEKAIRQTFLKIDTKDEKLRHHVYQSIWQIYEDALKKQTDDAAILQVQRIKFDALTAAIEAEFSVPLEEEESSLSFKPIDEVPEDKFDDVLLKKEEKQVPSSQAQDGLFMDAPAFTWDVDKTQKDELFQKDSLDEREYSVAPSDRLVKNIKPSKKHKKFPKKKRKVSLFWIILWTIWLIVGVWSILTLYFNTFGLSPYSDKIDDHSPAKIIENSSENNASIAKDSYDIFLANNIQQLKFRGNVVAKLIQDQENSYVHIETNKSSDEVVIPLAEDFFRKFGGKVVNFDFILRKGKDNSSQLLGVKIEITCDFGKRRSCGTFHYDLPFDRDNLLLQTVLPKDDRTTGSLILKGDKKSKGYSLDLYKISVSEAKP